MRLDKCLADAGIGTRSEVKKIIQKKQIQVNEVVVTDPGLHVTEQDQILFQGNSIFHSKNRYYMFHKPAGCVSATEDHEKTVLDYFENKKHLFPVGRLDKDTEGLLFITDDGAFCHALMSPKKHVPKTYYFVAKGQLVKDAKEQISQGIDIGDETKTLPGELEILSATDEKVIGKLTIYEGRYHQVKRMISKLGATVIYLKRMSIGTILLDEALALGEYRELTDEERKQLLAET